MKEENSTNSSRCASPAGNEPAVNGWSARGPFSSSRSTPHRLICCTGVSNTVPAGYYGEITAIAPMIRDTGNFAITMGDTSWNLTGVLRHPQPDGAEHFGYHQHRRPAVQPAQDRHHHRQLNDRNASRCSAIARTVTRPPGQPHVNPALPHALLLVSSKRGVARTPGGQRDLE